MMDIFISRPTEIATKYETSYKAFDRFLVSKKIKRRRLGESDYSNKAPLKAVIDLMRQCKGAIILGYPQHEVTYSLTKGRKKVNKHSILLPTPWNQIEGTLAYKQKLPVLVVAQNGVEGGLFDYGVTGEFVYKTNLSSDKWFKNKEFLGIFQDWKNKI
jgi:hypothetical protein